MERGSGKWEVVECVRIEVLHSLTPHPRPAAAARRSDERLLDALRGEAEARRRDEQRREDDRRRDEERRRGRRRDEKHREP